MSSLDILYGAVDGGGNPTNLTTIMMSDEATTDRMTSVVSSK